MIDYMEVGKRIRYYRLQRGITQEQLAFEIETSAAYLSNIERAIKKPSLQKIIQIAESLNISIDNLLSSSPAPQDSELADLEDIVFLCSESDRNRLLNNLYEIISILDHNR